MLSKKSLLLVLDANVFADILCSSQQNWKQSLKYWFEHIIQSMEHLPSGKTITIMGSTEILKDYHKALCDREYSYASIIKFDLRKSITKKQPIYKEQHIDFVFMMMTPIQSTRRMASDRFDESYFKLINTVYARKKWSDRHIIIATKDTVTYNDMYNNFNKKDNTTIVDSIPRLEAAIKC